MRKILFISILSIFLLSCVASTPYSSSANMSEYNVNISVFTNNGQAYFMFTNPKGDIVVLDMASNVKTVITIKDVRRLTRKFEENRRGNNVTR